MANILGSLSLYCRAPVPCTEQSRAEEEEDGWSLAAGKWEGSFPGVCDWVVLKVFWADYWRLRSCCFWCPGGKSTLEIPENIWRPSFLQCLKTLWPMSWDGPEAEHCARGIAGLCWPLAAANASEVLMAGWKEVSLKWGWWKIGTAVANVLVSETLPWVCERESYLTVLLCDSPCVGVCKKSL